MCVCVCVYTLCTCIYIIFWLYINVIYLWINFSMTIECCKHLTITFLSDVSSNIFSLFILTYWLLFHGFALSNLTNSQLSENNKGLL